MLRICDKKDPEKERASEKERTRQTDRDIEDR